MTPNDKKPSPVGQEHFERADWKKIVLALVDYAYRRLGPERTWKEAMVMARAMISLALEPDGEIWDPREETLMVHLGRTLRDTVILVSEQRGRGRAARDASPDWEHATRTYNNAQMRAKIAGPAGLPISKVEYFRARRRLQSHALDVIDELRPAGKR